jgi:hypothetical protein
VIRRTLAGLGGFAQLGQSGSLQAIEIPLARSGLCQKMFGDLQRRCRPLANKSSIGNDIVQRAAQNRDRRGIVGLAHGHARPLSGDNYDKMTASPT